MDVFTTEALPAGWRVAEVGSMITNRRSIQISQKGLLQSIVDRNRNGFVAYARNVRCPSGQMANAVIGTRISTSTAQFTEGTMLIVTYYGTAVRIEPQNM